MKKQHQKTYKIATIGFLVLSIGIILFPRQGNIMVDEVQFVRNNSQLPTIDRHGSAGQRDYLFEEDDNTKDTETITPQAGVDVSLTIVENSNIEQTIGARVIYSMKQIIDGSIVQDTAGIYQGSFGIQPSQEDTQDSGETGSLVGSMTNPQGKDSFPQDKDSFPQESIVDIPAKTDNHVSLSRDCTTPRGQSIADKDFVLAYEQRKDVPSMCNVERRICDDGVLEGSYTQDACQEHVVYEYKKVEAVSYNQAVVNPLVQPEQASNAGANFGTDGKPYQEKPATSMRGPSQNTDISTSTTVEQTSQMKQNCTTPRGTKVNHGQFVKAYKSSIGLLDVPCETQLRLCVNGILKGNFTNASCTFQNITYNDYIAGNTNFTKPTPQDMIGTLTNQDKSKNYGVRDWIKGVFK